MRKFVSEQASFVLYLPEGWTGREHQAQGQRTLSLTDAEHGYAADISVGLSQSGEDALVVARRWVAEIARTAPDLTLGHSWVSAQRDRLVFDGVYSDAQGRQRTFRSWVSCSAGQFTAIKVETPAGELEQQKQPLLTLLSNVRLMNGAFESEASTPITVPLVQHRLSDGSAWFQLPQDWDYKDVGVGSLIAGNTTLGASFMVAGVEVLTPQLGVSVPGVPVSPYLAPHLALQFLGQSQGLLSDMAFLEVVPRDDLAQHISQVYTAGPVSAEEFVYTFQSAQGQRSKGFTFGVSFGSWLGANWRFWHMTVGAPLESFDAWIPTLVQLLGSYRIDDQFAMAYIAQGMERLRQMQQETMDLVRRSAQDVHQMMQAAYDERQKSADYIDYQRTNYIRGEQDWISTMEGGTVYHTDSWGTKNTTTSEYWEGAPFDYVHFTGGNPKYQEQMTPIDNRELWERFRGE